MLARPKRWTALLLTASLILSSVPDLGAEIVGRSARGARPAPVPGLAAVPSGLPDLGALGVGAGTQVPPLASAPPALVGPGARPEAPRPASPALAAEPAALEARAVERTVLPLGTPAAAAARPAARRVAARALESVAVSASQALAADRPDLANLEQSRLFDGAPRPAAGADAVPAGPGREYAAALRPRTRGAAAAYLFGVETLTLSMPLLALSMFRSFGWLATMAGGWGVSAAVAGALGGGLFDRVPARKALPAAMALQAAAVAGIVALATLGPADPWLILGLYSVAGAAHGVAQAGFESASARQASLAPAEGSPPAAELGMSGKIAAIAAVLLMMPFGLIGGLMLLPATSLAAAAVLSRLDLGGGGATGRTAADAGDGARILWSREFRWLTALLVAPVVLNNLISQIMTPIFARGLIGLPLELSTGGNQVWLLAVLAVQTKLQGLVRSRIVEPFRSYFHLALPAGSAGRVLGLLQGAALAGALAACWLVAFLPLGLAVLAASLAVMAFAQAVLQGRKRLLGDRPY